MGVELSVRHTCVVCTILPTVGTVYSIVIFPLRLGATANPQPATRNPQAPQPAVLSLQPATQPATLGCWPAQNPATRNLQPCPGLTVRMDATTDNASSTVDLTDGACVSSTIFLTLENTMA